MPSKLVAFVGLAGSGKDTAAEVLIADGWTRVSFAGPMRAALLELNPDITYRGCTMQLQSIIRQYGWDIAKRECPPIRTLLQRLGTDVGRQMWGEDFWVELAARKIDEAFSFGENIVITDCRFPNEAELVRKYGGTVVKIRRPGVTQMSHASEAMDFDVDKTIHNDGDVEYLHDQIRELVKYL